MEWSKELLEGIRKLHKNLTRQMWDKWRRHVSFGDLIADRWETARSYGFGEGSSCYDNVLIIGEVKVGRQTWIGPNVILDGSGGLEIGDYCSISAGVQIYTHHTVNWATSMGTVEPERNPTRIGSGVFIGPQTVIQMGLTIGDQSVIGAMSFVNSDIPPGTLAYGVPARVIRSLATQETDL